MIGFDISFTVLLNFDLCTSYETGPSCICKSNQSVHNRLKIIHLNFQNMELTSVHHNSGQLFECSDVISVQPHELRCFIASPDKKNGLTQSDKRYTQFILMWIHIQVNHWDMTTSLTSWLVFGHLSKYWHTPRICRGCVRGRYLRESLIPARIKEHWHLSARVHIAAR